MVEESPSDSTRPPAEGRRLSGGAIASLSGVGLLLIFMIQNTQRVRLDFLFWTFTWPLWLLTMASAGSDSQPAPVAERARHNRNGPLRSLGASSPWTTQATNSGPGVSSHPQSHDRKSWRARDLPETALHPTSLRPTTPKLDSGSHLHGCVGT